MSKKVMLFLGIIGFLMGLAAGLQKKSDTELYAEASADIADTFPLSAETMEFNPQFTEADGPYAVLHTSAGDITILLYEDEAPKAVENFIRLSESGYYDGCQIFYVKKDELAQTGKPAAKEGETDPNGEPLSYGEETSIWNEPFEDELTDRLHNFPGAVGMAGNGMDQNLSQFYLVVSEEKPEDERVVSASMYVNELVRQATEELNQREQDAPMTDEELQAFEDDLNHRIQSINTEGIPEPYRERYQPAVDQYMKYGGKWGLDYKQTVFGQIVKGFNVAKALTEVKVNAADRSPKQKLVIESIEIFSDYPN